MANYKFRQQPVFEKDLYSVNDMNSEQAVRVETVNYHLLA
jgi:hypothetical protein